MESPPVPAARPGVARGPGTAGGGDPGPCVARGGGHRPDAPPHLRDAALPELRDLRGHLSQRPRHARRGRRSGGPLPTGPQRGGEFGRAHHEGGQPQPAGGGLAAVRSRHGQALRDRGHARRGRRRTPPLTPRVQLPAPAEGHGPAACLPSTRAAMAGHALDVRGRVRGAAHEGTRGPGEAAGLRAFGGRGDRLQPEGPGPARGPTRGRGVLHAESDGGLPDGAPGAPGGPARCLRHPADRAGSRRGQARPVGGHTGDVPPAVPPGGPAEGPLDPGDRAPGLGCSRVARSLDSPVEPAAGPQGAGHEPGGLPGVRLAPARVGVRGGTVAGSGGRATGRRLGVAAVGPHRGGHAGDGVAARAPSPGRGPHLRVVGRAQRAATRGVVQPG
ncbi:hypothetical protein HRbin32_02104 [bacterium HR32]|nr:hypothetical protein HRbin32_02104 [bacterium HR32]